MELTNERIGEWVNRWMNGWLTKWEKKMYKMNKSTKPSIQNIFVMTNLKYTEGKKEGEKSGEKHAHQHSLKLLSRSLLSRSSLTWTKQMFPRWRMASRICNQQHTTWENTGHQRAVVNNLHYRPSAERSGSHQNSEGSFSFPCICNPWTKNLPEKSAELTKTASCKLCRTHSRLC